MKNHRKQVRFAVRRLKQCQNALQNDTLVSKLLSGKGSGNIFDEIRKLRGQISSPSSHIDNEVGQENISNRFADIYSELYSKVDLNNNFHSLKIRISDQILSEDFDLSCINESLIDNDEA